MNYVLTLAEVEALPDDSVVLDFMRIAWQKGDGLWFASGLKTGVGDFNVFACSPLTLIYNPDSLLKGISNG